MNKCKHLKYDLPAHVLLFRCIESIKPWVEKTIEHSPDDICPHLYFVPFLKNEHTLTAGIARFLVPEIITLRCIDDPG